MTRRSKRARYTNARRILPRRPLLDWELAQDWHALNDGESALQAATPWDDFGHPDDDGFVDVVITERRIYSMYCNEVLYSTSERRDTPSLLDVLYETEKWAKRVLKASRKQGRFYWSGWL